VRRPSSPGARSARGPWHPEAGPATEEPSPWWPRARCPEAEKPRGYVTLIPGDGIGPRFGRRGAASSPPPASRSTGRPRSPVRGTIGEHGTALPPRVLTSVLKNKVALRVPRDPVGHPPP
jgi:hypothetical protein